MALLPDVGLVRMVRVSQMEPSKKLLMIACWGSLFLAAGCGEKKETVAAASPASRPAPASSTIPPPAIVQTKADDAFTVTGPLVVEHEVDVTAQRDGIVSKISTDAGIRVRRGKTLAELDDRQISSNLQAARAKTRSIEADLKNWQAEAEVMQADYVRAQRLWDLKLISEEQLQHAKFKAESEKWDIQRVRELLNTALEEEHSLELELEKTRITAPFDGLVARRYVRAGQAVTKGERLFWVTEEAPLRMRFTLPEKFVGHLKDGEEWTLSSPDVSQEKHKARVVAVSPVVDPASGTIEVQVELVGPTGRLRPGMTANVNVVFPQ